MTTARMNPYLNFRGEARAAIEFYRGVFGGELSLMTFGENNIGSEAERDHVMHSQIDADGGLTLMAADVPADMPWQVTNGTVSLSGTDRDTITGWWNGLTDGATIVEPLNQAPWGDTFGMLTDRFGVSWLVNMASG